MSYQLPPGEPPEGGSAGEEPTRIDRVEPSDAEPTQIVWSQQPVGPPPEHPPRKARPNRHILARVLVSVVLVVFGTLLGMGISNGFWRSHPATASHTLPVAGSTPTAGSLPFGEIGGSGSSSGSSSSGSATPRDANSIAAAVSPALVDINVTDGYQSSQGAATGIVLTPSGLVLTNNHVIDGATSISATDIGNGKTYSATVVGYDHSHDIAVIQLNGASGLKTATFGDSSKAAVGDAVIAIGNAGGTGGTPSVVTGSLVALDQQITASDAGGGNAEQLSGLMQTDADIQPGDSGGPLVNTSGEVIGVDTAASSSYSFDGQGSQGFAIPSNTALQIANQIINRQSSDTVHIGATPFLGVAVSAAGGQGYGYGYGYGGQSGSATGGAGVTQVVSGSPAEHAGIQAGDVIVSVNGKSVDSPSALSELLGAYHPGDTVQIGWLDQSGGQHSANVTLATGPAA